MVMALLGLEISEGEGYDPDFSFLTKAVHFFKSDLSDFFVFSKDCRDWVRGDASADCCCCGG